MGVGEPAPNAGYSQGYYGGTRPLGETAPNAGYSQGYCGGNRPQRGIRKGCRWLLSRL